MSRDLQTLLNDAAPAPRTEVDVDAVLAHGAALGRRRTAGVVVAMVLGLAGAAGVVNQLIDTPTAPIIAPNPGETSAVDPAVGTYLDGAVVVAAPGESPVLDVTLKARLHGVAGARLSGVPDAVAVAADGAVGVLEGTVLSIERDGEEIVRRDLMPLIAENAEDVTQAPTTTDQILERQPSIAFDTSGTLWAVVGGPQGVVAGIHRDGDATVTAAPDAATVRLRVVGDVVSTMAGEAAPFGVVESSADVVEVVGTDPLAGVQTIPVIGSVRDMVGTGVLLTETELTRSSVLGAGTVRLEGVDPIPLGQQVSFGTVDARSQVADTEVSIVSRTGLEPSLMVVHRGDTVAGALLDDSIPLGASTVMVAPDGSVYMLVPTAGSGRQVLALLGPDLRPVEDGAASAPGGAGTDGAASDGPSGEADPALSGAVVTASFGNALELGAESPTWNGVLARRTAGDLFMDQLGIAVGPDGELAQIVGDEFVVTAPDGAGPSLSSLETTMRPETLTFTLDGTARVLAEAPDGSLDLFSIATREGTSSQGGDRFISRADTLGTLDELADTYELGSAPWSTLRVAGDRLELVLIGEAGGTVLEVSFPDRETIELTQLPFGVVPDRDVVASAEYDLDRVTITPAGGSARSIRFGPVATSETDQVSSFWSGRESVAVDGRQAWLLSNSTVDRSGAEQMATFAVVTDDDGRTTVVHLPAMDDATFAASALVVGADGRTYLATLDGEEVTVRALVGADMLAATSPGALAG